jgi:TonB family protein
VAVAGARYQLDLAPAPLFLRKRHLKQRVVLILKEGRMSKTHLISALAGGVVIMAAVGWLSTGTFPLMAAPQIVNDAPGVSIDLGGTVLMHRTGVPYPATALQQGVQGTLAVEVKLDANGNVADARVLSGPDELRRAAIESVLQWHFTRDSAGMTRVVRITFASANAAQVSPPTANAQAPTGAPKQRQSTLPPPTGQSGVAGSIIGGVPAGVIAGQYGTTSSIPCAIKSLTVVGLPDSARDDLLSRLSVHAGDPCGDSAKALKEAREFDEHLSIRPVPPAQLAPGPITEMDFQIFAPGPEPPQASLPGRIRVGGNVQAAQLIDKVPPVYPPLARSARIGGTVHLAITIGKDGRVQDIRSLGGPALLIQSAMDAVRQWVYRPTLLNGNPVEVETTVDLDFTPDQ